jgi:poly-gamma-glutamate capsule biosynthesis protein CapA/YwtB (metallophosphatase superfamily)
MLGPRVAGSVLAWHSLVMRSVLVVVMVLTVPLTGCRPDILTTPPAPFSLAAGKKEVSLFFAGDASLARGVADTINAQGEGDPAWVFHNVRALVENDDLVFMNLECVLADTDEGEAKKTWRIRAPRELATALTSVGTDVVSVANNHALDFASPGFKSTLRALDKLGIRAAGVQYRQEQVQDPVIVQVGELRVGFLAYNAHGDEHKDIEYRPRSFTYRLKDALADVARVRDSVDLLVVSLHWGPELSHLPWPWQETDAKALVDAGAGLVLGHHPHVIQPYEQYKGALIVYSFGDFIFDKSSPWLVDRTNPRYALRVRYSGKVRTGWEILPLWPDKDRRPGPVAMDTSSWEMKPLPDGWSASSSIKSARVERVGLGEKDCHWTDKRVSHPAGYVRWLAPRFACADEKRHPEWSVGLTAEFAQAPLPEHGESALAPGETDSVLPSAGAAFAQRTLRRGVWAAPHHRNSPLRLTFPEVVMGDVLEGYVGVPDWWARKAKPDTPPVRFVLWAGSTELINLTVPAGPGPWLPFRAPTEAMRGRRESLVVEVTGGLAPADGAFVFDAHIPEPSP